MAPNRFKTNKNQIVSLLSLFHPSISLASSPSLFCLYAHANIFSTLSLQNSIRHFYDELLMELTLAAPSEQINPAPTLWPTWTNQVYEMLFEVNLTVSFDQIFFFSSRFSVFGTSFILYNFWSAWIYSTLSALFLKVDFFFFNILVTLLLLCDGVRRSRS